MPIIAEIIAHMPTLALWTPNAPTMRAVKLCRCNPSRMRQRRSLLLKLNILQNALLRLNSHRTRPMQALLQTTLRHLFTGVIAHSKALLATKLSFTIAGHSAARKKSSSSFSRAKSLASTWNGNHQHPAGTANRTTFPSFNLPMRNVLPSSRLHFSDLGGL